MLSFTERQCSFPKTFWSRFADWIVSKKDVLNHTVCAFPSDAGKIKYLLIFFTLIVTVSIIFSFYLNLITIIFDVFRIPILVNRLLSLMETTQDNFSAQYETNFPSMRMASLNIWWSEDNFTGNTDRMVFQHDIEFIDGKF